MIDFRVVMVIYAQTCRFTPFVTLRRPPLQKQTHKLGHRPLVTELNRVDQRIGILKINKPLLVGRNNEVHSYADTTLDPATIGIHSQ